MLLCFMVFVITCNGNNLESCSLELSTIAHLVERRTVDVVREATAM